MNNNIGLLQFKKKTIQSVKTFFNNNPSLIVMKKICDVNNNDPDEKLIITREFYLIESAKHSKIEFFQDEEIFKMLQNIHETTKFPLINYLFWTKSNNYDNIINTLYILIKAGYNLLDRSKDDNETTLESLIKANKEANLKNEIFEKCYEILTHPDKETQEKLLTNIFNKIVKSNYKLFRTQCCWLLYLNPELFVESLWIRVKNSVKCGREQGTGKYTLLTEFMSIIKNIINDGPIKDSFDMFFKDNKWISSEMLDSFDCTLIKYISNVDYEDLINTDICGAVLGFVDKKYYSDVIELCTKNLYKHPSILINFMSHANNYSYDLVVILLNICDDYKKYNATMQIKFTITDDLSLIFETNDAEKIKELSLKRKDNYLVNYLIDSEESNKLELKSSDSKLNSESNNEKKWTPTLKSTKKNFINQNKEFKNKNTKNSISKEQKNKSNQKQNNKSCSNPFENLMDHSE